MTQQHPLSHLEAVLVVAIGGFAGANLRYLVELAVPSTLVATLTVNVVGCGALGFLFYQSRYSDIFSDRGMLVLGTGFLSSFTTYSTFVVDIVESAPPIALVYVLGSYALGFAGVLLGREGARLVAGAEEESTADDTASGGE